MFEIRKLKKEDLKIVYPFMEIDFPDNERKPLRMLEESFDTGFMEGYGLFDHDEVCAYALFMCQKDIRLFDYLAVVEKYRDQGVGSQFLRQLHEVYQDMECVIGEVENPDYCKDEEEKKTMERRIDFYLRNGFLDTGAACCLYSVEYRFFEMGLKHSHTPEEAQEIMGGFYHVYWPQPSDYARYVQMHEVRQ